MEEVNELLNGYFSAILFAETDLDTEESLDQNYSISDFDKETVESSKKMLSTFYSKNKKAIEDSGLDLDTIGNDIWYTRAGHGAGFFDHNLDRNVEKELTNGAKALGEHPTVNTYDGKISVSAGRVFKYKDGGSMKNYSKSDLQSMSDWSLVQLYCAEMGGIDENDLMIEVRGNIEERQNLISQLLQKYAKGSTVEGGFDEKAYHLEERAKKQLGVGIGISDINKALKRYENENSQNAVYQSNKLRQLKSEMEALILHYEDETKYAKGSTFKVGGISETMGSFEQYKNKTYRELLSLGLDKEDAKFVTSFKLNQKYISDMYVGKKNYKSTAKNLYEQSSFQIGNKPKYAKGSTVKGNYVPKGYRGQLYDVFAIKNGKWEKLNDEVGGLTKKHAENLVNSINKGDERNFTKGYSEGYMDKEGVRSFQKFKNGGGIDINELNIPVIRTQFEEEDFEFEDGGRVEDVLITIESGNDGELDEVWRGKNTKKNQPIYNKVYKNEIKKGKSVFLYENGVLMYTDFADLDEGKYSEGGGVKKLKRKKFLLYTNPNNITNMAYVALGDSIKRVMQSSRAYPDSYTILYTAMGTNEDLQKAKAMFSNYSFTNDITIMKDGGGVGNIAKKGMRVFDPHDVVSDKGKWKEDLEMYLTNYWGDWGDAYGDPEKYIEKKPNIKFHDYDSKKTSFLKRNPSNVIAEYAGEIVGKWDADLEEGYIYYDKMKDGGNVVFSPVAVEKANIEELFEMAEEIGLKNYHNLNKEFLRKKILQKFNVEFKTGGVGKQKVYVDLFEDYENIPKKVQEIVDEYGENFGGDGSEMDYQDTANMLKDVEAVGYTFSYGLDNEPFGLRPIGVRLNQLRDYEDLDDDDYAEGGVAIDNLNKNTDLRNNMISYIVNLKSTSQMSNKQYEALEKRISQKSFAQLKKEYYTLKAKNQMKKGGGIDINDLNMPVIRTQFEEEDFEFEDGGKVQEVVKGKYYNIYDPGMDTWNDWEYISYIPGYHIFREEAPMGSGTEIKFTNEELKSYLKENLIKKSYKHGGGVGSEWTVTIIYPSDNKKSGWISNDSIDIKVLANSYESAKQKAMNKFKKIHSGKKGTVTSVNSNTHKFLDNAKLSKGSTVKGGKFNVNGNYLDNISNDKKNEILKNIANHYGISLKDAEEEVKDADAEMLYDYIANDKSLKMEIYNHFEKSGIGKIAFPIKDKMANGGLTKGFEYTIGGL